MSEKPGPEVAPDGYAVCPRCGHHTSAYCGSCTVMVPQLYDADGVPHDFAYCGCDCAVALGGEAPVAQAAPGQKPSWPFTRHDKPYLGPGQACLHPGGRLAPAYRCAACAMLDRMFRAPVG